MASFSVSLSGSCTDKSALDEFHRAIAEAAATLVADGGTIGGSFYDGSKSHQIDGKPTDDSEE